MTTTPKTQKDKSYSAAPKLAPRQTAASTARALRNATNRNLFLPSEQRQSPSRTASQPPLVKVKKSLTHNPSKSDSKSNIKLNRNADQEIAESTTVIQRQEIHAYFVENESVVVLEEITQEKNDNFDVENSITIEEINETDNLESKGGNETVRETPDESTEKVTEQVPYSRPNTPSLSSRPQTPKSMQSSRPQTPRPLSRPTTPVAPRHGTPACRPNTPQISRPSTPGNIQQERIPASNSFTSRPNSPSKEDTDIKTVYSLKQKQFHNLKKELDLKQQAVLELFDSLRGLRERMCQQGLSGSGEGLQQQELVLFNVADWATDEVAQLCRDAVASSATSGAADFISNVMPFDEHVLAEVDAKAANVPARFADLCVQAITTRQEIIDCIKEIVEKHPEDNEILERISQYNAQGFQLCEALRELKVCADSAINSVSQLSRQACQDRMSLVAVGERLVREIAKLRQDLEARTAALQETRHTRSDNETVRMLEETRRELEEERAARSVAKDKLSNTEAQLRQTRQRVSKMDRQLREADASIASLTSTVKTLEDQSRQKEVHLEARARKLRESLKTGEVASSQIAQHRDALQIELAELKDQLEKVTAQHKTMLQDITNQLKVAKQASEEQKAMYQREVEQGHALRNSIKENQATIEDLRTKITELENNRPNPDLPTEREMDLWAELQATKDTLRMTEEEIVACKREKARFLETMSKISESDNKVSMQQKLAAELLSKEEIVSKLQIQIRELTKTIKLNEQKVAQYEQYVQNLQAHNRAVANCQEAPNGISYQDLQQEIMHLKMSLLEAMHRNEELTELLMQKDQQLEQQDKTSRAQARVIKVREELINMLKNKETEQGRELAALQQDLQHRINIVGEVNNQIASKAAEIQELFATLENKQQQIHRLEKVVLALEEQQRRAQAQRTRHEEKIAALEHELAANGSRRERKYLFF